ncbi:MAG: leucine-rich repeat domain-containing protein [Bacteroidaceae bacterium]|nr:leucine-rich repeat domain-containing protein [Bacteroidaceae bacterium]
MDISGLGIRDLTGISYFYKLTTLNCSRNQLQELDLTSNTALTELDCSQNQLTGINLAGSTNLNNVSCFGNKIFGQLIELPTVPELNGTLYVAAPNVANEQNRITDSDIASFKAKGWNVYQRVGTNYSNAEVDTYAGVTALPSSELSFNQLEYEFGEEDDPHLCQLVNNPYNMEITYTSTNPSVATVDATTGEVTLLGIGKAIIKATCLSDGIHEFGQASYSIYRATTASRFELYRDDYDKLIDECADIIATAKTVLAALPYDSSKTEKENKEALRAIIVDMVNAIAKKTGLNGDVNADGVIDAQDASLIQQKVAGKISW